jgi:tyrosine aminotransferase
MYAMLAIDARALGLRDDAHFCEALLREENVAIMPGAAFGGPGFARIVLCAPLDVLADAADRMRAFCERHAAEAEAAAGGAQ